MYNYLLLENVFLSEEMQNILIQSIEWLIKNKDNFLIKRLKFRDGEIELSVSKQTENPIMDIEIADKSNTIFLTFSHTFLNEVYFYPKENLRYLIFSLLREYCIATALFKSRQIKEKYLQLISEKHDKDLYKEFTLFINKTAWFYFFTASVVLEFENKETFKKNIIEIINYIIRNLETVKEMIHNTKKSKNLPYFLRKYKGFIFSFLTTFLSVDKRLSSKNIIIHILDKIYFQFDKFKMYISILISKITKELSAKNLFEK